MWYTMPRSYQFSVCKYINKIQIKKYLVNIFQFINKEQRTMNVTELLVEAEGPTPLTVTYQLTTQAE